MNVKSFLRVWGKLFQNPQVFLRQSAKPTRTRASIRAKATFVKEFLRGLGKLAKITEVCGCTEKIVENLRKTSKNSLTFRPRARPPGIRLRYLHDWGQF